MLNLKDCSFYNLFHLHLHLTKEVMLNLLHALLASLICFLSSKSLEYVTIFYYIIACRLLLVQDVPMLVCFLNISYDGLWQVMFSILYYFLYLYVYL